jgi:predicted transcriptional regulator
MNEKTINNIKETLNKISKNDTQYSKILTQILDIELKNLSDQEKSTAIKTIIDLNLKGSNSNDSD